MLFPDLANKIVREVRRLITENIIIINIEGVIIASTDTERIGQFHEGAPLRQTKENRHHYKRR